MCDEEGKEDMFATKQKPVKKPVIKMNKFANLSKKDWQESNESSKESRGMSGLNYKDIYGG